MERLHLRKTCEVVTTFRWASNYLCKTSTRPWKWKVKTNSSYIFGFALWCPNRMWSDYRDDSRVWETKRKLKNETLYL